MAAGSGARPGIRCRVEDHSFFATGPDVVIPYGVYDLAADAGWVTVRVDHDTSAVRPAGVGGRGRPSWRPWPPRQTWPSRCATSRRAPQSGRRSNIRLFSQITLNWRGRPLTSHDVVVKTIAATRTGTGLHVEAELDTRTYPLGCR